MVAYTSNELVSSTNLAKKFGTYLNKIENNEIDKLGVLKNNQLKVVMLSSDEYEKICQALELVEDYEIYNEIKERLNTPKEQFLDGDEVLDKLGLSLDDV
jgi:PHD/YefM family antitoxin component YafN of YafNO toxin-antitoxin module